MAIIFDGKQFAAKKFSQLKIKVNKLKNKGINPKLVSILVGDDPASHLYVNLKKRKAEEIGCELEIKKFSKNTSIIRITRVIKKANKDKSVHGIMVQLPLPKKLFNTKYLLLNTISKQKDIDGLRKDSAFIHPTAKAVLEILRQSSIISHQSSVAIVGSTGMVGSKLIQDLRFMNYEVAGFDSQIKNLKLKIKNFDVVISATGVPNLIKADMVKDGAIVIDVGSPRGDVDLEKVKTKVSFITPVPGGVGPVTVAYLLENLVEAAAKT